MEQKKVSFIFGVSFISGVFIERERESGTPLIRTLMEQKKVSGCPLFQGCSFHSNPDTNGTEESVGMSFISGVFIEREREREVPL